MMNKNKYDYLFKPKPSAAEVFWTRVVKVVLVAVYSLVAWWVIKWGISILPLDTHVMQLTFGQIASGVIGIFIILTVAKIWLTLTMLTVIFPNDVR
jgi:hypothetical protein